jgi:hypothetical protein
MANNGANSNDCNRTIRVTRGLVTVNEGQHLHYSVTVEGATPVFSLSCKHKTHFDAASLGAPRKDYEVIWERTSADSNDDDYTFAMSFIAALKYTLRVVVHDASHQVVGDGVIVDADYESEDPEMSCFEGWVVRT